jgi:hypothetical protein
MKRGGERLTINDGMKGRLLRKSPRLYSSRKRKNNEVTFAKLHRLETDDKWYGASGQRYDSSRGVLIPPKRPKQTCLSN